MSLLLPTRRRLLQASGGLLGVLGLGLGRPARAASDRRLLIWWNKGGWDTTFVFDPHFESGSIERDPDSEPATLGGLPIAVADSRPAVTSLFERWGDRACIVNGLAVGSISHDICTRLSLTGRRSGGADLGAIVASQDETSAALPYLALGAPAVPGPLGEVLTPLNAVLTGVVSDTAPEGGVLSAEHQALLADFLAAEGDARSQADRPRLQAWRQGLANLGVLREHADLLADLPAEPTQEDLVALGVALLTAGLTRVLSIQSPLPDRITWDSHTGNQLNQSEAFQSSFSALETVLDTLEGTELDGGSLLDRTTVLVLSEMGRTPVTNQEGGKDHWPYTSALLLGAGVAGGRVVGATDEALVAREIDLATGEPGASGTRLTSASFLAGLLAGFDVDPEPWLPGVAPFSAWQG